MGGGLSLGCLPSTQLELLPRHPGTGVSPPTPCTMQEEQTSSLQAGRLPPWTTAAPCTLPAPGVHTRPETWGLPQGPCNGQLRPEGV